MGFLFSSRIRNASYLQQLIAVFVLGILSLSMLSSFALANMSSRIVRARWATQGLRATEALAEQVTLALLYLSAEDAEAPVRSILAFPDVRGVSVFGADHSLLLHRGEALPESVEWPEAPKLERETEHAWQFVAPVFARRGARGDDSPFATSPERVELIGFVRLIMGKDAVMAMEGGILRINFAVSGGFALLLLLVLASMTRRLTTPINHLAETMGRASAGEKRLRAAIAGPRDIVDMELAFNAMMDVLENREQELESARDAAVESARLNALLTFALNHVNVIAGLIDEDGRFFYVNEEAVRALGYSAEEIRAMTLVDVGPGWTAERWRQNWKEIHEKGAVSLESEFRCKDGSTFPVEVSANYFEYGSSAYIVALARDITERKRNEEEVRQLNQGLERRVAERTAELEAANKELESFAYSVSHDLRAPLRHIDGFLGLLKKRSWATLDDESQAYIGKISDAAKRGGTLIDDLLSFSRMGRKEMAGERVVFAELAREVIEGLEPDAEGRAVRWQIGVLPVVRGDRAMLREAVMNLLSNALKFTRGREPAEIEIGSREEADETVFFVRDNGVGFDPRYSAKLFGVFQRLHGATEFEGTGIGLANVRRIITRHGGRTWAEGTVDGGATFYFSLPVGGARTGH